MKTKEVPSEHQQILKKALSEIASAQHSKSTADLASAVASLVELEKENFQQLIRTALNQIPVILWVVNQDGIITLTEGAGLKAFGVGPNDLVGKCHFDLYKDRPDLINDVKRALAGETFRVDQEMSPFYFEVFFTPYIEPSGEITKAIGVTVDITERKKLESELQSALSVRDTFFAILSHELKSPLATIKMQADLKLKELKRLGTSETDSADWELVARQSQNLSRLVDEMLDIARIQSGKFEIEKSRLDLSLSVRRIIEGFESQYVAANQSLSFAIEDGIQGSFDEAKIAQALSNLLSNCLRHAPGAPVTVQLKRKSDKSAELLVVDEGPGIKDEDRGSVFEIFKQGETRHAKGLGLGLFITRSIIEAHGGTIQCQTGPNKKGTAFVIDLPV